MTLRDFDPSATGCFRSLVCLRPGCGDQFRLNADLGVGELQREFRGAGP